MEDVMANTILKELREFRTENNQKWEENDKRWEQNEKRWQENDKRWEQNEKRWQENDKRWEQNEKRWQENDRRWEENNKRWNENQQLWKENKTRWDENKELWKENKTRWDENKELWQKNVSTLLGMNQRITALEKGRKKDRNEIIEILDRMQKSIDSQFAEMKESMDAKFEKICALQRVNDIEHEEFRKLLYAHEKRVNFHSARLTRLEEWKDQFDMGEFTAV